VHTVTVRALGKLHISHNGEAIDTLPPDAMLLFAYLSLFPGFDHIPSAICEALFPGDGGLARLESAQQALFAEFPLSVRLFRGISVQDAIRLDCGLGVGSSPPLVRLETDVLDLVQALESDWRTLGRREAAALLTEAAAAMDRVLLPDVEGAWKDSLGERLCMLFRQASVAFFSADVRSCATIRKGRLFAGMSSPAESLVPVAPQDGAVSGRFYGRESELDLLRQLLQEGERIVSIVGLGGVGKSRLALELLQNLPERFHGWRVAHVALGNVTTRAGLLEALRKGLGQRTGDLLQDGRDPLGALCRTLYEPTLLYLDNVEDAVREPDGEVVKALGYLSYRCPETVILATSRCRIGIPDEYVFALEGLALPTEMECQQQASEDLYEHYPALEMLDDALKGALKGGLASVGLADRVALLRHSGGLPLSIELLAMRSATNGALPDLETLPATASIPRQAIDWALDPLSEATKAFLTRLSVFRGAFTPEDAEIVTGDSEAAYRLTELDDAGLVAAVPLEGALYRLPAAVRDTLRESQEALPDRIALEESHAAHYARIAVEGEVALRGPERVLWLPRLRQTLDDVLEVIRFRLRCGEKIEQAAEVISASVTTLGNESRPHEGIALGEQILAALLTQYTITEKPCVVVRDTIARLQITVGYFAEAEAILRDIFPLLQEMKDIRSIARAANNFAVALNQQEKFEEARSYYEVAWKGFTELGERRAAAQILQNVAYGCFAAENWSEAHRLLENAYQIVTNELPEETLTAKFLSDYAEVLYIIGRYEDAERVAKSILRIIDSEDDILRISNTVTLIGLIGNKMDKSKLAWRNEMIMVSSVFSSSILKRSSFSRKVESEINEVVREFYLKEIPVFDKSDIFELRSKILGS
jgi:predicted ATPase